MQKTTKLFVGDRMTFYRHSDQLELIRTDGKQERYDIPFDAERPENGWDTKELKAWIPFALAFGGIGVALCDETGDSVTFLVNGVPD